MHCIYCGTVIVSRKKKQTHAHHQHGLRYADGRLLCNQCHQYAVKTISQLDIAWQHVKHTLKTLDMTFDWKQLPIHLVDKDEMEKNLKSSTGSQVAGVAMFEMMGGHLVRSKVNILYGMPAAWAVETLAHESAHVWCRQNNLSKLPNNIEEGVCNVVACLALQRLGKQYDAPKRVKSMFINPDPIYGIEFRKQWKMMEQVGWSNYKNNLIKTYG